MHAINFLYHIWFCRTHVLPVLFMFVFSMGLSIALGNAWYKVLIHFQLLVLGMVQKKNVSRHLTPAFRVTCIGDIFVHLSTCHLSTCYLNGFLTVKQAIFHIISGRNDKQMIITDLTWLKKFVNIACFQIYMITERFTWSRLALNGEFRYNLGRYALGIRKM